jgi:hypothetical protein
MRDRTLWVVSDSSVQNYVKSAFSSMFIWEFGFQFLTLRQLARNET